MYAHGTENCIFQTGSKIPQRIEQKSKGDSTLSSEDRSVDSSKERSQSNKIECVLLHRLLMSRPGMICLFRLIVDFS